MIEVSWVVTFLFLGGVVGFIAGLLGVGGGGILVPVLTYIFLHMGVEVDNVMHIALGTSMACIIVTSTSSLNAHNKKGTVSWEFVKIMSVGIVLGTFIATFVASYLNSIYLAFVFLCYMLWTAINMFRTNLHSKQQGQLKLSNMFYVASGIGAMSALVSIGGGSLTVPYLVKKNIELKTAIGTSAAIGLPVSVAGTLGYLLNGLGQDNIMTHSIGFIYLPAVLLISISSFIFAPLGVKAAHYLPVQVLKVMFSILLVILSVKMLWLILLKIM